MPRNRYTKLVRKSERAQLTYQERELIGLVNQLRRGITGLIELPIFLTAKQRRNARLEQNHRRRPHRSFDSNP